MEEFIFDLSILLVGSAILSCLAILLKQPIIIAYMLCGLLVGPYGLGWIKESHFIENISHLGITLLLFLAGLYLRPEKLISLIKKTTFVTFINSLFSFTIAFAFSFFIKLSLIDSLCIALALMFSSTILCVKLLPTTTLHQQRIGALCISVLILQDLLAIAVLAFIRCLDNTEANVFISFVLLSLRLFIFIFILWIIEKYILSKVIRFIDRFHEAIFILGLAWCLGIATVSHHLGLFYETGAFFSGVILARHQIAYFIAEKLKPIRDFFLVLFFFSLGARLDLPVMKNLLFPALILTSLYLVIKPYLFQYSFVLVGEEKEASKEIGIRLGQLSEFSLLISLLAMDLHIISVKAGQLIQLVTILSIIISSYLVIYRYPTPIGTSEKLIRD